MKNVQTEPVELQITIVIVIGVVLIVWILSITDSWEHIFRKKG